VHIKEVYKHKNGLAAMGIQPLARGPHHQGAVPPQAHGMGIGHEPAFRRERAVVIVKALVQSIAPVQEITADESGGFVTARLQHGSERHDAGGNALAVFFHTILKRVGGSEQRRVRRQRERNLRLQLG
jgi:hypothetical protein